MIYYRKLDWTVKKPRDILGILDIKGKILKL